MYLQGPPLASQILIDQLRLERRQPLRVAGGRREEMVDPLVGRDAPDELVHDRGDGLPAPEPVVQRLLRPKRLAEARDAGHDGGGDQESRDVSAHGARSFSAL